MIKRALELPERSPVRKQIIEFLSGETDKLQKATYKGKSKKITSKEVIILILGEEKSKVRDLNGNETTVSNSQLKF